jgi:pyruvate formate lyase activating enzyme
MAERPAVADRPGQPEKSLTILGWILEPLQIEGCVAMLTGTVFDIKKYSINDGPGIRTTLFLKGCPLRCWWCHNPESQGKQVQLIYRSGRCDLCGACLEACQHSAIIWSITGPLTDLAVCQRCGDCTRVCYAEARQQIGREMSLPEVMAGIERDVPFYDESGGGVTISGGEPLFQQEFSLGILKACREKEIHTVLDTCGYASPKTFRQVLPYVSLFLYDLKLIDAEKHRRYTGLSNELILQNLRELSASGTNIQVRIPLIPGINDDEEEMQRMGQFLSLLPHRPPVELLAYHNIAAAKYAGLGMESALPDLKPPTPEHIRACVAVLEGYGLQVKSPQ